VLASVAEIGGVGGEVTIARLGLDLVSGYVEKVGGGAREAKAELLVQIGRVDVDGRVVVGRPGSGGRFDGGRRRYPRDTRRSRMARGVRSATRCGGLGGTSR
jgi:hypothetical protein